MTKYSYYFPHDDNAHNDPKLVKLSMSGWDLVGLYWAIVGMLHEQGGWLPNDPSTHAFALRVDMERIAILINFPELFIHKDKMFSSNRVLENLKIRHEKREKAQISALKRWNNASAMRTHSDGNAIKKEKKEKKVFLPPTIEEVDKYCKERKNNVNPSKFIDHYQAREWKFKTGSPVKDWKACVRTWEHNGYDQENRPKVLEGF